MILCCKGEDMQYTPKVSIIIPAYNASNYLAEAIESALNQTYKNIEIIVVNDGSSDDGKTVAVAEKYADRIRYFEKENGGSSSAINVGIRNMTGEWFSWLSHDDLYTPDKIHENIKLLNELCMSEEKLKGQIVTSASALIDGDGKLIKIPSQKENDEIYRYINKLQSNAPLIAEPTKYMFHGCTYLVHKAVFDNVGMFDEKLRLLNDWDMWFRIYAAGYHVNYIPKVLVKGRIHKAQVSRSIGFSYQNPEQDMFWQRCYSWLSSNCQGDFELFYKFGRNAYVKTRSNEGDMAFDTAVKIAPEKAIKLKISQGALKSYARLRELGKRCFLSIIVGKG